MDIKNKNLEGIDTEALAQVLKEQLARKDPWIFITEFCKTNYSKQGEDGLFGTVSETIPPFDYLKKVVYHLHHSRKVAIPKSRRMLITWVVLCYCLWYVLFHEDASVYLQKLKEDDAGFADPNESLCSRVMKVYNKLPPGLKQKQELGITKKPPVINFKDTRSIIFGVAEGPDQLRGKDASIIVIDEMAMLDKNKETITTIMPIVNTGAKLICISTPNGQEYFYKICKGLEEEQ